MCGLQPVRALGRLNRVRSILFRFARLACWLDAGLPLGGAPPEYELDVSPVLVHDPGHQLDISLRIRNVSILRSAGKPTDGGRISGERFTRRTAKSATGWAKVLRSSPQDVLEVATQSTDPVADRDAVGIIRRVAVRTSDSHPTPLF